MVGADDNILIDGFSIGGTDLPRPRTMLIRAVGPGLTKFGVTNTLTAPRLALYAGERLIATSAGWETSADVTAIRAAAEKVGAFPPTAGGGGRGIVGDTGSG